MLIVALVLVAAACDWTQYGYGPAHTGYNPTEKTIGVGNVASLNLAWTAAVTTDATVAVHSSVAVAKGVAYLGVPDVGVVALSANGSTGCSGTPKTCTPLWTSDSDGSGGGSDSTPAVVGGFVYAAVDGALEVYDAAGSVGCSGTPKRCAPLWTASDLIGFGTSPTVVNGVVYVGSSSGRLYAFDAAGSIGCSGVPKTCAPLWTTNSTIGGFTTPAIANGVVYVAGVSGKVYAYDAAGSTGCSGVPKLCLALWTAPLDHLGWAVTAPVVANGTVFVTGMDGRLYALDAAGSTGCSGTPKTCVPPGLPGSEPT